MNVEVRLLWGNLLTKEDVALINTFGEVAFCGEVRIAVTHSLVYEYHRTQVFRVATQRMAFVGFASYHLSESQFDSALRFLRVCKLNQLN